MTETIDLINHIQAKDFNLAGETFHELLQAKMTDALEQQKAAVAGKIFNGDEDDADLDDEEQLELDLEIDAEIEDAEDEELEDVEEESDEDEN